MTMELKKRPSREKVNSLQGKLLLLLVLVSLSTLFSSGCSSSREAGKSNSDEGANIQPSLFEVPPDQLAHLQIVPVKKTNWTINVRTTGTVDWDNDHTTQAITQVNGPITKILVDAGTYVKAGQPLLYVSSPDIANAIAAYRVAKNRLNLATLTLNRNRDLLDHHAIAQRDFESVEADYNDAATQVQNSLQPLKILGISQKEIEDAERQGVPINPELAVRSPISGMIVQKLVFPGQFIQAGTTTCFLISDVSTVWVQGHIYEKDLTHIRVGDPVEETNPSFPDVFHGVVSYIGAMVDPATRTTPVRIVTRNPHGLLKKDLFVDVVIRTKTQKDVLTVPTAAVLRDSENQPFVYVLKESNKFAQQLISVGATQDNQVEVSKGLQEGEQVVGQGSVFLQFANTYQR